MASTQLTKYIKPLAVLVVAALLLTMSFAAAQTKKVKQVHDFRYLSQLNYLDKLLAMDSIYFVAVNRPDLKESFMQAYQEAAIANKEKSFEIEANYMDIVYNIKSNNNIPLQLKRLDQQIKASQEIGNENAMAKGYYILSDYWMGMDMYESAFEFMLLLENLIKEHGYLQISGAQYYFLFISKIYYRFKDYDKTIALSKYIYEVPLNKSYHLNPKWSALNTIGICYQNMGFIDSSNYYFQLAIKNPTPALEELCKSISYGNIGYNFYIMDKLKEAEPLLENDYFTALKYQDYGVAGNAATVLGALYSKTGRIDSAKLMFTKARHLLDTSNQYHRFEKYYKTVSDFYVLIGDYHHANVYKDSFINAYIENINEFNSLQLNRALQKIDVQRQKIQIDNLSNLQRINKLRLIVLAILVGLIFLAMFIFLYIRRKQDTVNRKLEEYKIMFYLRDKISIDMHDEVGSTLSSIMLYAHSFKTDNLNNQQLKILDKIKNNSKIIQSNIKDIIWSIKPEIDKVEDLVIKMRLFGAEICDPKDINFIINVTQKVKEKQFGMMERKNIYLIFKEAINNAVKYSNCTIIKTELTCNDKGTLKMTINDNGDGFDLSQKSQGNGLYNMKKRAEDIGGELQIESEPGNGTTIYFKY